MRAWRGFRTQRRADCRMCPARDARQVQLRDVRTEIFGTDLKAMSTGCKGVINFMFDFCEGINAELDVSRYQPHPDERFDSRTMR